MASTATFTASVQYSPPSGPANSGSATFSIASSHAAQNVGNLDIPAGTPPGTAFSMPSSPTVAPITDATIVVYGSPTVIEVVQTFVFGD